MGCGTSKSTNVVTPAVQTGKSEKVEGKTGNIKSNIDRQTGRKGEDSTATASNLLGVADKPTISVSKKELPLAKPVESSSESYLSGSGKSEGQRTPERNDSKEDNKRVLVEKTEKVFITQTENGDLDRRLTSSTQETVLYKEEEAQLETSSDMPKEVVKENQEDWHQNDTKVVDSNVIHIDKEVTQKERIHSKENLQKSIDIPPEISKDTEKNITAEIPQFNLDSETTDDQFVVDRKDSVRQIEDGRPMTVTEGGEGSPRGRATPIKHVISEILGSSKSVNKDSMELKSSGIKDYSTDSEGLNAKDSKPAVVKDDMVWESVHKDVAMEINGSRAAITPDGDVSRDQGSHVMSVTNEDPSGIATTTDLDHEKKIVMIRVKVDDEFESELTTKHPGQNINGSVSDSSCYGNQRSSTASKGESSDDVMPQINFSGVNQLLTPESKETAASGKSLNDITASTGSFSRSPSWSADKQSKIEKLVNEELDVHPSIRNVSPALGFTRSVLGACLGEVAEEGEGEKEAENGDKERTKGGGD